MVDGRGIIVLRCVTGSSGSGGASSSTFGNTLVVPCRASGMRGTGLGLGAGAGSGFGVSATDAVDFWLRVADDGIGVGSCAIEAVLGAMEVGVLIESWDIALLVTVADEGIGVGCCANGAWAATAAADGTGVAWYPAGGTAAAAAEGIGVGCCGTNAGAAECIVGGCCLIRALLLCFLVMPAMAA